MDVGRALVRMLPLGACCLLAALLPRVGAAAPIRVDTTAWPTVAVSVALPSQSGSPPRIFENGVPAHIVRATNVGRYRTIALVVDHSQSMDGQALATAVAVARRLVADKKRGDRLALFAVASKARQLTGFATSVRAADKALAGITVDPRYGTALNDGVAIATRALKRQPGREKLLMLVSDGQETTSRIELNQAAAVASAGGVAVYPVAIADKAYRSRGFATLARATGGAFFGTATRSGKRDARAIASDIRRTWRIDYRTTAPDPGRQVTVSVVQPGARPLIAHFTAPGDAPRPFLTKGRKSALFFLTVLAAIGLLGVMLAKRLRRG